MKQGDLITRCDPFGGNLYPDYIRIQMNEICIILDINGNIDEFGSTLVILYNGKIGWCSPMGFKVISTIGDEK